MIRPLVWVVIWVDEHQRGHGTCGHRHLTAEEATSCPWEPPHLPPIGAGLVRQVRDPDYIVETGAEIRMRRRSAALRAAQLELALGAAS